MKNTFSFNLQKPTSEFINKIDDIYINEEGNEINRKLSKLFESFPDNSNKQDVTIKVAALNSIYSTAITNIKPVVNHIVKTIPKNTTNYSLNDYISEVDKIATIQWENPNNGKSFIRHNLSFASKFIHFLSNKQTPIYDSYIWILMIGYFFQKGKKYSFSSPKNYLEFYSKFEEFKNIYSLNHLSNYAIDKFLWQYGKTTLFDIIKAENVNLNKAKSILKKRIVSNP